jgi:hypothetical protein
VGLLRSYSVRITILLQSEPFAHPKGRGAVFCKSAALPSMDLKAPYKKKQIPNPQVKDLADQFWTAADLLMAQLPGTGVSIPAIINCVFAERW